MRRIRLDDGLTPGQRTAKRGHVGARAWDPDFAEQQMRLIADYIQANPWVQSQVGRNVKVHVSDVDRTAIRFEIRRQ